VISFRVVSVMALSEKISSDGIKLEISSKLKIRHSWRKKVNFFADVKLALICA
jgi:hypothetical protein